MWNPWFPFLGGLYVGYIIFSIVAVPVLLGYVVYVLYKKNKQGKD